MADLLSAGMTPQERERIEKEFTKAISLVRIHGEPVPSIPLENFKASESPVHRRKIKREAAEICSVIVHEIVEQAMITSERKGQNIIVNLIQRAKDWLSTSVVLKLERNVFWPDTDIYEERVLFLFHLNDSKFRLAIISFVESPLFQVKIKLEMW